MYLGAPVNRIFRPDIAIAPGAAVVTAGATPALHHAAGGLHGSVFFKMLDDAAFFAAASQVEDVFVVTASFHVTLLRPITTGAVRSVGRVVRAGAALVVAEAILLDPAGREAARGIGDFARSRTALADVPGYRGA
jgi:uncharacterized protein (TIGR00369 family)